MCVAAVWITIVSHHPDGKVDACYQAPQPKFVGGKIQPSEAASEARPTTRAMSRGFHSNIVCSLQSTRTPDESDIALAGPFQESPEGVIVPSDANVPRKG